MPPDSGVRRAHGEGRRGRAGGDHHVLLPAPGRPDPSADRSSRDGPGRATSDSGPDPVEPLVPGDLEHQGRVRYGPGAGRPFHPASRRAQPERDRGGAESRWTLTEGARDAHFADSHASGDARVQIGSKERSMATRDSAATKFETVRYEKKGAICHIILNRPEKLNAANDRLVEDVNDALFEFDADPDLLVAILTGAGRAFCSGADVQQRQLRSPEEMRRLGGPAGRRSRESGLADTVNWKPVIAAVHGYALGLGYALAQSCDLVVAAEGTQFQIREVQRGLGGGQHWVATWFWTGSRFANEVALTGRMFTAEEALRHGMVNRVVPSSEMISTAEALAVEILENPPLAVRANVRVMRWFVNEMQRQSRYYTQGLGLHLSEDFQESARAFVEKRKPTFKGR